MTLKCILTGSLRSPMSIDNITNNKKVKVLILAIINSEYKSKADFIQGITMRLNFLTGEPAKKVFNALMKRIC